MALCRIVATRGTCNRLRCGAVLVKDKRIIATGYNGSPPGMDHCDGPAGHLMEEGHCVRTVHAEHNAILQAAVQPGTSSDGSTLYTLYSPCIHCAKYVAAAGIKRVVCAKVYRNRAVVDYLQGAGVEVEVYIEDSRWNQQITKLFSDEVEEKKGNVVLLRSENN